MNEAQGTQREPRPRFKYSLDRGMGRKTSKVGNGGPGPDLRVGVVSRTLSAAYLGLNSTSSWKLVISRGPFVTGHIGPTRRKFGYLNNVIPNRSDETSSGGIIIAVGGGGECYRGPYLPLPWSATDWESVTTKKCLVRRLRSRWGSLG